MNRISTNMSNNNMQYNMRYNEWDINQTIENLATTSRINNLRDDPIAAAHSSRLMSRIKRNERYIKNNESMIKDIRFADGYIKNANDIVHRIRELAVHAANSPSGTAAERKIMANEVDQLLEQLVEISNAVDGEQNAIFAGNRLLRNAFDARMGSVAGGDGLKIIAVDYRGSIEGQKLEVDEQSFVDNAIMGNKLFWAEQQQIMARQDNTDYVVSGQSAIFIDNTKISLQSGDNIHSIISKINDSNAPVKAQLDQVSGGLILTGSYPHQIWLQDDQESTVLADLGIINNNNKPPQNIAVTADITGGSLFDMVINLRDALYRNDVKEIGGSSLAGISIAQNHLIAEQANLSARVDRLEHTSMRLQRQTPQLEDQNYQNVGLDIAEAITNKAHLDRNMRINQQMAARINPQTLLDFLR